jgi:predicted transcriptional regulator
MSIIDNLDKVLNHIYLFSENLASIPETEMSMNTGIEIDELSEYLEELSIRGFISNFNNGSYITLKGRLAIENSEKKQPFKDELKDQKLNRYWSITKIIAGVLNAVAIIGIAIWSLTSTNEKTKLESDLNTLIEKRKTDSINQKTAIDSLKSIITEFKPIKSQGFNDSYAIEIPQGTFIYELYFAEFGGRMKNSECKVTIKGNKVIVEQTKTNLTGGKTLFSGFLLKHKNGKWILANNKEDMNANEIGGCTEIPIIYFDKKLIEWC